MTGEIIGLQQWFETPPGRYLLEWEQARFDEAVADLFGYHAVQLGLPQIDGLRTNRVSHRWLVAPQGVGVSRTAPRAALVADATALPFAANSLDLVLMPHTLDLSADPHAALREVERVLVPEGKVIISSMNPASLWGLRQRRAKLYRRFNLGQPFLPETGDLISYRRMRDWLRLLGFELESGRFGLYRPAVRSELWLERMRWFDQAGQRWWPFFGAVYFLLAVKRVRGMTLLLPARRRKSAIAKAPVPVAGKMHRQSESYQGSGN